MIGPVGHHSSYTTQKILIVEDSAALAQSIRSILKDSLHYEVLGVASTVTEAIGLFDRNAPDIIILDLRLPDRNGMEMIEYVRGTDRIRKVKIVVMTVDENVQSVIQALRLGVQAYLFKMTGIEQLLFALNCVAQDQTYFDREVISVVKAYFTAAKTAQAL